MNLREYETTFIVVPNLSDEETNSEVENYRELVEKEGGKEIEIEIMGKRKLAYEIKKHDEGFYAVLRYRTGGRTELVSELERRMRTDENILRFLTIRLDLELKKPRKIEERWRKKREKLESIRKQVEEEKEGGEE